MAKSRLSLSWMNKWHSLCVQVHRTYNFTLSTEMLSFWMERAWKKAHLIYISFSSTARKNNLQSYKMTSSHFRLFHQCPKFTLDFRLDLITIWETTGVGKKGDKTITACLSPVSVLKRTCLDSKHCSAFLSHLHHTIQVFKVTLNKRFSSIPMHLTPLCLSGLTANGANQALHTA